MKTDKNKRIKSKAEEMVMEFLRCKNSFEYFCSKYILIELPGGDVPLIPYEPQRKLIDLINNDKYVLVLKSRQIGISTITQAYVVWLAVFFDNAVIGIISKDAKEATDFARAIRGMIDKLPKSLSPQFDKYTEQSFILKNGSKVYASPVNPNAPEKTLRGKAITFLVIDEAAFVKFIDEAWTSMVPALSTNQMHAKAAGVPYGTVVLSTPNKTVGVGKWFYERYTNAVSGNDIFKDFVIHWQDVKELANDPDWYDRQCALFDHDKRKIEQELELKFLSTEGSFFDEQTIQALQEPRKEPIEKHRIFNGELWRYADPREDTNYIMGVDTAPEHGQDFSAISVWDFKTLEQVAEYQGKLKVTDFIKVIKVVAEMYDGTIVVESNSYGNQVIEDLDNSKFAMKLYKEKRGVSKKSVAGLSTNVKTRPLMIDALYSYVTQFPECIKSKRLILELIGLTSKPSGKVEADIGCHDDIALSTAMCFYVHKWDPPLLMDKTTFKSVEGVFEDVINMNSDKTINNFNNSAVINHVKSKMLEKQEGYIDIFSMFSDGDFK